MLALRCMTEGGLLSGQPIGFSLGGGSQERLQTALKQEGSTPHPGHLPPATRQRVVSLAMRTWVTIALRRR